MKYLKDSKQFHNSEIDDIINFFKSANLDDFKNMLDGFSKLNDISNQIDQEEEKDYSELKYTLMDELDLEVKKWKNESEKVREDLYMEYYTKYGRDLFEDLRKCKNSIEKTKDLETLSIIRAVNMIFNDSKIKKEMDDLGDVDFDNL